MKSGKAHQEEEDDEEEEFGAKNNATPSANSSKNGKNSDKANATRSKHSVTEQRRRSKINERFQILRELIPHSDQKRDTASFMNEVIQYVQYLQEKVQKYEGSYQPWSSEPTKLMPWRNSHWRNFVSPPQTIKNSSSLGPGPVFPVRFDENGASVPVTTQPHNPIRPDHARDGPCRPIDSQTELPIKTLGLPVPMQATTPVSIANDGTFLQSSECPDTMNLRDDLAIEGGTISISSVYSQELLNSLTQALESTGVDLSQASMSVQINLGKRSVAGVPIPKDHSIPLSSGNQPVGTFQESGNCEDLDQAQKRQKL
ncbi:hypothetical protein CASFOL_004011 [Castilleja foliolosa]|uniref:BHLH domain-containing protein n=1 Tax=Castilleja foliolosa TaxID=1961234 RepID=A0ABD3EIV7_9LAMI